MNNVIPISAARPSPVQLRRYAVTQARALLCSAGISATRRTVASVFDSKAGTNLDAISNWIYKILLDLTHLRAYTLESDSLLRCKLRIVFYELLERVSFATPFD